MLLTNLFRLQSKLRLTLFLICSYFFSESEAHCSYKIVLKKKRVYEISALRIGQQSHFETMLISNLSQDKLKHNTKEKI